MMGSCFPGTVIHSAFRVFNRFKHFIPFTPFFEALILVPPDHAGIGDIARILTMDVRPNRSERRGLGAHAVDRIGDNGRAVALQVHIKIRRTNRASSSTISSDGILPL